VPGSGARIARLRPAHQRCATLRSSPCRLDLRANPAAASTNPSRWSLTIRQGLNSPSGKNERSVPSRERGQSDALVPHAPLGAAPEPEGASPDVRGRSRCGNGASLRAFRVGCRRSATERGCSCGFRRVMSSNRLAAGRGTGCAHCVAARLNFRNSRPRSAIRSSNEALRWGMAAKAAQPTAGNRREVRRRVALDPPGRYRFGDRETNALPPSRTVGRSVTARTAGAAEGLRRERPSKNRNPATRAGFRRSESAAGQACLRRTTNPSPVMANPSSARVAGSGTVRRAS
jgi:hypothetical protein